MIRLPLFGKTKNVTMTTDKLVAAAELSGSPETFAERLGFDLTTMRKWEQGRARPNRRSLKIIKNAFVDAAIDCAH